VPRDGDSAVLDGEQSFGIHAQEGIAPDLLAALDALQQERGRTGLGQLEVNRNRRFQVGQQRAVDGDQIALVEQAAGCFVGGGDVGARAQGGRCQCHQVASGGPLVSQNPLCAQGREEDPRGATWLAAIPRQKKIYGVPFFSRKASHSFWGTDAAP
jgi:hypothetical protein